MHRLHATGNRLWKLPADISIELRELQTGYKSLTSIIHMLYYYSFKIFFRFWLVKTTRIIHHSQVLFTKFGKHLRHIESMTSKVERIENYWTNDVKMTSKVQPAVDYWTVDRENLGTRLCYIWWAEKRRAKWRNCFKNEKYFEWIIKQLWNLALVDL